MTLYSYHVGILCLERARPLHLKTRLGVVVVR